MTTIINSTEICEHLLSVVERIECENNPFSHFYTKGWFPDHVYKNMIENLPDTTLYDEVKHADARRKDGTSTRHYLALTDPRMFESLKQPEQILWGSIKEALCSPTFKKMVFKKLQTDLAKRFDIDERSVEQIEAYPSVFFTRDVGGYRIKIHPDAPRKIVTMQFYLPNDDSQIELGTSIYKKIAGETEKVFFFEKVKEKMSEKMMKSKLDLGYKLQQQMFEKVKTFEFTPNSGYGFAVGKKSFHDRDELGDKEVRNTLMCIWNTEPRHGY